MDTKTVITGAAGTAASGGASPACIAISAAADTKIDVKSAMPARFEDLLNTPTQIDNFIWCADAAAKVSHSYGDRWYSFKSDPGNFSRAFVGTDCIPYDANVKYADMDRDSALDIRLALKASPAAKSPWWFSSTLGLLGVPNAMRGPGDADDGGGRMLVGYLLSMLVERKIANPVYGRYMLHVCGIDFDRHGNEIDRRAWGNYTLTCVRNTLPYDDEWETRATEYYTPASDSKHVTNAMGALSDLRSALFKPVETVGDRQILRNIGALVGMWDEICEITADLANKFTAERTTVRERVGKLYNAISRDIAESKRTQESLDNLLRQLPTVIYYNPEVRKFFTDASLGETLRPIAATFAPDPKKMSTAQKLGPSCTVYVMGPALQKLLKAAETARDMEQILAETPRTVGVTAEKARQVLLAAAAQK